MARYVKGEGGSPKTRFAKGKSGNPGGRSKIAVEVRDLARAHTEAAIERLIEIMKSDDLGVAVMAIKELLDRGWGKSIGVHQHEGKKNGEPIVIRITGDSARL